MKIVLYEEKHRESLEKLLKGFAKEVFDSDDYDVDRFVEGHWAIYLSIGSNSKVIGFNSFNINEYFGLRKPTLANTYMYILPEHRGGKSMYLFAIQAGKISIEEDLPLEHFYSSESSSKMSSKLEGKKMYDAYIYEVVDVKKTFGKLIEKVRIK